MTICLIYAIDLELCRRYQVGSVSQNNEVPNWLKTNGLTEITYEVWKNASLHSRWIWKDVKKRWGKTATPQK